MNLEPRALAVAESYPTFWDDPPLAPAAPVVAPDEAYTAFVNLTEDDLPADDSADSE